MIKIKVLEIFNKDCLQSEVDFININTEKDTALFIEPYRVKNSRLFPQAKVAYYKVESLLKYVYELYEVGEREEALKLLMYSQETNELHLGYARDKNTGRGVSEEKLDEVFNTIINQRNLAKEILTDPAAFVLFVPNFAEDRMSDLISSIIKKELLEYTLQQALLIGVEVDQRDYDYGFYWDEDTLSWEKLVGKSIRDENDNAILLTPKDVVVFKYSYSPQRLMNSIIFPSLKEEHLLMDNSPLVRKKINAKGEIILCKPTNKMLYDYEVKSRFNKDKIKSFVLIKTLESPTLYFEYVNRAKLDRHMNNTLTDAQLDEINN